MTSEAGTGFSPSRAATASAALRLLIVSLYCLSASSLLLYETDSTFFQPSTFFWSASTAALSALSERNAWMVTRSSTLPTRLPTSTEPSTNMPITKSDRKMVTIAPRTVDQLRRKWRKASWSEYPMLDGTIEAVASLLLIAHHMAGLEGDHAPAHGIDHLAVMGRHDDGGPRTVDAVEQPHDAE